MTDSDQRPDGSPARRRAPRTALRLSASVREPGRSRSAARLIDISTHGCRVEITSEALRATWVSLRMAGWKTQYCRVVWRCHECAGIEFATPLAEAVLKR